MRFKIEKLKKKDLSAFNSIFTKALHEDFKEYSPEVAAFQIKRHRKSNLFRWIKQGEENIFLAKESGKKVVGMLVAQKIIGGVSNCDWLIVAKGYRRQGVGTKLLIFWENWIKKNKGHMLTASCARRSLGFYKKYGFRKYGFMSDGYFGNSDYLMLKKIGNWNKKSLIPQKNA